MRSFSVSWGHVQGVLKINKHNFETGWGSQPPEKQVVDYPSKPTGIFIDFLSNNRCLDLL
jgi:hypothetical protein